MSEREIIPKGVVGKLSFCEHCVVDKSTRQSFQKANHNIKTILDYIHSDLWGPSQIIPSLNNSSWYFLIFTYDYSRKSWFYFLKAKYQTLGKIKEWKTMVEKQTSKQVKCLITDNGLEFCNEKFNNFCKEHGITRHRTVRYTPQQNDVSEMLNRTIMDRVRCQMLNGLIPENFCAKVVFILFTPLICVVITL